MATGKPISYDDIISPEIQKQLDTLAATVNKLTAELTALKAATASEDKAAENYNDTLRDTVEITDDLLRLTQDEVVLKKEVKKATDKYNQAVEEGAVDADKYNVAAKKGTENLRAHNFVVKNAVKLANARKTSMTELSLELAKNRMAYRNLTKAERDNEKIGGKLVKTIKTQDAAIKKLDKSIGNHQRNVGNYTKAMGKATTQTRKWSKYAVVAVGAALVGAAKNMQAASDAMDTVGNGIIIQVANIQKALKGDISWADAFDIKAIRAAAVEMNNINRIADYQKAQQNSRLALNRYEIEQRKLIMNDTRQTYGVRIAAVKTLNKYLEQSDTIIEKSYNQQKQQYLEILKNDPINIAAKTALLNLEKERDDNLRQNAVIRTEIQRAEIKLTKDSETAHLAQQAAINSGERNRQDMYYQTAQQMREINDTILKEDIKLLEARLGNAVKYSEDWYRLLAEGEVIYQEHATRLVEIDAIANDRLISGIQNVAGSASQILGTMAEDNKAIQIAQAIINTFAAAVQVLANEPGEYIIKAAAMVATIATGLAQVAKIQATQVPSYAVGTDELESDQLAQVHKGERILPAYLNKQLTGIDNAELPRLVNIGLKVPKLLDGIETMVSQQRNTNSLLSRFAYVDNKGAIHYLSGNKTIYV